MKYWPEIGKCGFLVWRYLLRRDDVEPAPWTSEGIERSKKLGLSVQVWNQDSQSCVYPQFQQTHSRNKNQLNQTPMFFSRTLVRQDLMPKSATCYLQTERIL